MPQPLIMPKSIAPVEPVENLIQTVRGQRVVLDADLARIYGVPTKVLNQAVKRNRKRFPSDIMFQLTATEAGSARRSKSQTVTLKRGHNLKYRPYAFTEHGAIQTANVLNSEAAVQMGLFVVRAFVKMREALANHRELVHKLTELERTLTERLDDHEQIIASSLEELRQLMNPPEPARKQIGFHVRERAATYRVKRKP
jgi:phage regulator Rha-like protein